MQIFSNYFFRCIKNIRYANLEIMKSEIMKSEIESLIGADGLRAKDMSGTQTNKAESCKTFMNLQLHSCAFLYRKIQGGANFCHFLPSFLM